VHEETVRIVDLQMKDMATQMQALDDFVTRARSQNAQHHDSHVQSLEGLSTRVKSSYADVGSHFTSSYERVRSLGEEMAAKTALVQNSLAPLDATVNQPLAELRTIVLNTALQEYQPTGETPQKVQYQYPMDLPRTEAHETLLGALRRPANASPSKTTTTIPVIFNDGPDERDEDCTAPEEGGRKSTPQLGLREIDININAGSHVDDDNVVAVKPSQQQAPQHSKDTLAPIPSFKRSGSVGRARSAKKAARATMTAPVVALEGRENAVAAFSQSVGAGGRRRSPRGVSGVGSS
jgi:kinesin family protein 11